MPSTCRRLGSAAFAAALIAAALAREDDAYLPARTPEASRSLVAQASSRWLPGSPASRPSPRPLRPTRRCVPQLFPIGGHPGLADPIGRPWTVGLAVSYRTEALLIAQRIADTHPAGARVALVSIDEQFAGRVFEDALPAAFERFPQLELLGPFRHRLNGADAGDAAAAAAASGADVIVVASGGFGCPNALLGDDRGGHRRGSPTAWGAFLDADVLTETLPAANARPGGLTRTNVLLAARSLHVRHPVLPDEVVLHLDGNADPFAAEGGDLLRYQHRSRTLVATILADGRTPPCAWDVATQRCAP